MYFQLPTITNDQRQLPQKFRLITLAVKSKPHRIFFCGVFSLFILTEQNIRDIEWDLILFDFDKPSVG